MSVVKLDPRVQLDQSVSLSIFVDPSHQTACMPFPEFMQRTRACSSFNLRPNSVQSYSEPHPEQRRALLHQTAQFQRPHRVQLTSMKESSEVDKVVLIILHVAGIIGLKQFYVTAALDSQKFLDVTLMAG